MLTDKDTQKIAKLARIRLAEGEVGVMTNELNGILKWIEMLSEVNTDGVEPMASVVDIPMIMRTDVVNDGNVAEKVLANAPLAEYDCFAVPKVIE